MQTDLDDDEVRERVEEIKQQTLPFPPTTGRLKPSPAVKPKAKPLEHFPLAFDPLTGWAIEPAPTYRTCIPIYDAVTGELREFIL